MFSTPRAGSAPRAGQFRAVLGNAGLLLTGRTVTAVLSLATLALTARTLGIEAFGALVLIHAYAQTVGGLAKFQSWQAILHYGTSAREERRGDDLQRIVRFSALLDVTSALVGTAIGVAGAAFLGARLGWPPEIVPAAMLYATSIVFLVSATPTGLLRLLDRFDLLAVQSGVSALVRLVGAAILFLAGGGLMAFLVVWYVAALAAFCYLVGMAWREFVRHGHHAGFRWSGGGLTRGFPGLWRFVCTTNMTTTLELATTHVGTLAVGFVFGAADAALYRVARQVSDALAKPAKLVVQALYPELARLWAARDLARLRRLAMQVALAGGLVATLALALLAAFGGAALEFVMGEGFRGAQEVMLYLFAASVLTIWALPLEPLLISTGRAGTALWLRALVTIAYLAMLVPLMRDFGLTGAGMASLAAAALMLAGQVATVLVLYRPSR